MQQQGLMILTWNVGLLRLRRLGMTLAEVPHLEERLPHVVRAIRSSPADVVCVQEAFHRRHRTRLVAGVASAYPYVASPATPRLRTHSGLLLLSRIPLQEVRFVPFAAAPLAERLLVQRGVLAARVNLPGGRGLNLLNLHTTSGGRAGTESPAAERMRQAQLEQAMTLARAAEGPTLLCGDFNAGPEASAVNYDHLGGSGWTDSYVQAERVRGPRCTWDPANSLNAGGRFSESPPQRIDHVFLSPIAREQMRVVEARVVLDDAVVQAGGSMLTASDHYGLLVSLDAFVG